MKKEILTSEADAVPGILSQAIDTGSLVFVSGQIHITPEGELIGETTEEKVKQIMKNIAAILKAASCDMDNIVKATVYVTDLSQMPKLNEIYPTFFKAPYPAREAVCVKELPLGATIEISVVASK